MGVPLCLLPCFYDGGFAGFGCARVVEPGLKKDLVIYALFMLLAIYLSMVSFITGLFNPFLELGKNTNALVGQFSVK